MLLQPAFAQADSSEARRNFVYNLLQTGRAQQALTQLNAVPTPTAWDQYMKGQASEMIGEPVKASQWYRAALEQDRHNDQFRSKSIANLTALCKCDEAIQVCLDGSKLATDAKKRQFYDDKAKEIERLKQAYAKGAENIARHKIEHHEQLQSAIERDK